MRVSRRRWCSPSLTRLRSAGVSVSSRMHTSTSGPAHCVRAEVGPRPNCCLYSRTIALEISIRALVRFSLTVGCCCCSSIDIGRPRLAWGARTRAEEGLQPTELGAELVSAALLRSYGSRAAARPKSARASREERSCVKARVARDLADCLEDPPFLRSARTARDLECPN